jgi:hypothetical protein
MDIRQAWRSIVRMPVLASVVVVSLGVGIGINTAVFSWVQAMVLQPLPGVANASRILLIEPQAPTGSSPGGSWTEYRDLKARLRAFPDLFAFRMVPLSVGESGRPERAHALFVSGNYFSALGLRPALGRFLRADEANSPARPRWWWSLTPTGSPTWEARHRRSVHRFASTIGC